MWKKKYFVEKKKTPPLEDRLAQLKYDLDHQHNKTVQTIDAEAKHAQQMGYQKESDVAVRCSAACSQGNARRLCLFRSELHRTSDAHASRHSRRAPSDRTGEAAADHGHQGRQTRIFIRMMMIISFQLRNQAENECRTLRHELNQAKMNLNHIKIRGGA